MIAFLNLIKSIRRSFYLGAVIIIALVVIMTSWSGRSPDNGLPDRIDYNIHIRPILSQNCFVCHGNDEGSREAGLRLDTYEGATASLKSGGRAIVPGRPGKSLMIERITSHDPEFRMPPVESKKILRPEEIALLEKWVDQGAKYARHWSFIPLEMPHLPKNIRNAPVNEVIDYYIEEELTRQQLVKSELAEPTSRIRRLSYLLTGLPPDPMDVLTFIDQPGSETYEMLVDQYLASPSFGERWARHWMDLVRYGESMGHEGDFNISNPWEYRDYLIRAFNQDVPYNQLVLEHLAGDMLQDPRQNPVDGFNESMIGTAYFFLGEGKHAPVNIRQEEADKIDNMIDVTSKTFQGLTVACARCHDHKFDPIPSSDYYAMYGMIESSRIVPLPARKPVDGDLMNEVTRIQGQIKQVIREDLTRAIKDISKEDLGTLSSFIEQDGDATIKQDTSISVLADFRDGKREGWFTTGSAFGENMSLSEPVLNLDGRVQLTSDYTSSRVIGPGVQGVLHSPNFTIEFDSIVVVARGKDASIRVVVDNFQVFQGPLWDYLEAKVSTDEWHTYTLGVGLARGRKAYLEFFPGSFERHVYSIEEDAYIDIKYAVGFSGDHSIRKSKLEQSHGQLSLDQADESVLRWAGGTGSFSDARHVSILADHFGILESNEKLNDLSDLLRNGVDKMYDPTHFIGMTEGEAIFSPVFVRGDINQLAENRVPHGYLTILDDPSYTQEGSGRLAWAKNVVDPSNPLTARVMVNRIWHYLFGRGLVETVDNFGAQGGMPSHPDLLDYLSVRFMEGGWSIKQIIKEIVMSQAFQRSTVAMEGNDEIDPINKNLHSYPVRRLEAEALRDGILAVSGCLDPQMFGESIPVHLTEFMTGRGRPRYSGPIDGYGRRSIYTAIRRNFISPMMLVFDMPIPFSTFGKRNTTNVPAQSLTLMNDPFIHEQAEYWAENLLKKGITTLEEKIQSLYVTAFSRYATEEEISLAIDFLEGKLGSTESERFNEETELKAWTELCHSLFNLKEFIHLL